MKIFLITLPALLSLSVTSFSQTVSGQLQKPPHQLVLEKLLTDVRELPTEALNIKRVGGPSGLEGLHVEFVHNSACYTMESDWWSPGVKIQIRSCSNSYLGSVLIADNDADGRVDVGRFNDEKVFWSFESYGTAGQRYRYYWQFYYDRVLFLLREMIYR